jgi:hypothetical protein
MQPTTRADALMRREVRWVRRLLTGMLAELVLGVLVLFRALPYQMLSGSAAALILVALLWLVTSPTWWLAMYWNLLWILAADAAERSLPRFSLRRVILRRGRSGHGSTSGTSSGGTSPGRRDDGAENE